MMKITRSKSAAVEEINRLLPPKVGGRRAIYVFLKPVSQAPGNTGILNSQREFL